MKYAASIAKSQFHTSVYLGNYGIVGGNVGYSKSRIKTTR